MSAWLLALALIQTPPSSESRTPARLSVGATTETDRIEQTLDDGKHTRFGTDARGPVHVWRPKRLPPNAPVVVYLHGFFTDVDGAFLDHQLASQFRSVAKPALFVVPETRSWRSDPILWPDVASLLERVRQAGIEVPTGAVTVAAHSGGYKNVASWLAEQKLERVILLDGLYGDDDTFGAWVDGEGARQLVLVGVETQQRAVWFSQKHPTVSLDALPYVYDSLSKPQRSARVLAVRCERDDHMSLVTQGRVLPWLLRQLLP